MAHDTHKATDGVHISDDTVKPLPEDNASPFSQPTDPIDDANAELDIREATGRLDPTHPATDSADNIDSQQLYDEGLAGAAEETEPNAGNAVVGYDPEHDQRKKPSHPAM